MHLARNLELVQRHVRESYRSHFAYRQELGERPQLLLQRDLWVNSVELEKVELF